MKYNKKIKYPGELILSWLNEHRLSQAWLARIMGRPEKTISEIVNGKAGVIAKTAIELERVTDIKASHWLKLQNNFDLEKQFEAK